MKKNTHPNYQKILFVDSSTGQRFIIGSTLQPKERETFEGKEYPVYTLSTSAYSHPFFTGSNKFVDAEGRVDKFKKRYQMGQSKNNDKSGEEKSSEEKPAATLEAKTEAKTEVKAENKVKIQKIKSRK
jgi:large subunit ribosomal protein L31